MRRAGAAALITLLAGIGIGAWAASTLGVRSNNGATGPLQLTPKVVTVERASISSVVVLSAVIVHSAAGYEAVADIDPNLLYRFYTAPKRVVVKIDHGPAPFECVFSSVGLASGGESLTASQAAAAPIELVCRIPNGLRVFAGIRCLMAVTTAEATNALVIPLTAAEGQTDASFVFLVQPDASTIRHAVTLGINDGTLVEVLAGLQVGDRILDLPPSTFPSDTAAGA
jgi:multidrug efflux pump subunit AcrA (membrane-fusion protein)